MGTDIISKMLDVTKCGLIERNKRLLPLTSCH